MWPINTYIDHTFLKPTTLVSDVAKICKEAIDYQFVAVCIPPNFVSQAKMLVKESNVKVATVIGFPFGYSSIEAKISEVQSAILNGADELDVVVNISCIKNNNWDYLSNEAMQLASLVKKEGKLIKLIIESGILTKNEIEKCCKLYTQFDIDFLKTSTGYAEIGATTDAVKLFREYLPSHIKIKASGGIRNYSFAQELILAGADRIGCSASVDIINHVEKTKSGY